METFLTFVGVLALMTMTAAVVLGLVVRQTLLQARATVRRAMTEPASSPYVRSTSYRSTANPYAAQADSPRAQRIYTRDGHTVIEGEVVR